jgi:hypothetical protein
MWYLGGSQLEPPLAKDPGIIFFLFFTLASAMAFISLSCSRAAVTMSLKDRLGIVPDGLAVGLYARYDRGSLSSHLDRHDMSHIEPGC